MGEGWGEGEESRDSSKFFISLPLHPLPPEEGK